jgi:hypothetical protein
VSARKKHHPPVKLLRDTERALTAAETDYLEVRGWTPVVPNQWVDPVTKETLPHAKAVDRARTRGD